MIRIKKFLLFTKRLLKKMSSLVFSCSGYVFERVAEQSDRSFINDPLLKSLSLWESKDIMWSCKYVDCLSSFIHKKYRSQDASWWSDSYYSIGTDNLLGKGGQQAHRFLVSVVMFRKGRCLVLTLPPPLFYGINFVLSSSSDLVFFLFFPHILILNS